MFAAISRNIFSACTRASSSETLCSAAYCATAAETLGRAHDDLLDAVIGLQHRPLDDALGPVQEREDRAPDHARELGDARVRPRAGESEHVDRIAHLHVQSAIGGEEREHLRDVVRARERAVRQVEEAAARARTLAPEQRQRNQEDRPARALRRGDHLGEQVALLAPLVDPALAAREQLRAQARGAQEQEQRTALARQLAACTRARAPARRPAARRAAGARACAARRAAAGSTRTGSRWRSPTAAGPRAGTAC